MTVFNRPVQTKELSSKAKTYTSIIPLGDSITNQGGGNLSGGLISYVNRGYFGVALHQLGWPLQVLYNAGVSGQSSTQILARLQTDVIDRNPDICSILAGSNDLFGAGTDAQVIADSTISNLTQIYTTLTNAGIIPISCTLPCADFDSVNLEAWFLINNWIKTYCFANNIRVADFAAATTDANNTVQPFHYADDFNADNIHPDKGGAKRMGDEFARVISPLVESSAVYPSHNDDPTNLVANTLMRGVGGSNFSPAGANTSGDVPTGMIFYMGSNGGSTVLSLEDRGSYNEFQAVTTNATSDQVSGSLTFEVSTGINVGDVITPYAQFSCIDGVNVQTFEMRIDIRDSGDASLLEARGLSRSEAKQVASYNQSGAMQAPQLTIPAGAANILFSFIWAMESGTVTFSRPSLTVEQ